MAVSAGDVFKEIFARMRQEAEDYYAGRISEAEYARRNPAHRLYRDVPKDWARLFKKAKDRDLKG